jgi:hypothetical protein
MSTFVNKRSIVDFFSYGLKEVTPILHISIISWLDGEMVRSQTRNHAWMLCSKWDHFCKLFVCTLDQAMEYGTEAPNGLSQPTRLVSRIQKLSDAVSWESCMRWWTYNESSWVDISADRCRGGGIYITLRLRNEMIENGSGDRRSERSLVVA